MAAALVVAAAACSDSTAVADRCTVSPGAASAVVTIAWSSRPDTMRVLVENAETVRAACEYVETGSGPTILAGRIVRGAGVDTRVPFHYLPTSVELVDLTMELCDSSLLRTPEAVDAFFLGSTGAVDAPSAPFCPWGARPIAVTPAS